jgi:hypothetical protein
MWMKTVLEKCGSQNNLMGKKGRSEISGYDDW